MLINNVHIINNNGNPSQIEITGSGIAAVRPMELKKAGEYKDIIIDLTEAICFPGLINSHDHLEFNLFPRLRNKIYNDYIEWGEDIHKNNKGQIENIKMIPYDVRFKWGLYKNLICGITTVAHHGNGEVLYYNNLPDILTDYNYLHSIRTEKNWKLKLNAEFNGKPFVIHIGEGINSKSHMEIDCLLKWNYFSKEIIGVHGISLDKRQCSKLRALVWCPDSNIYLYNKTANISELKSNTTILFGTDSSVSANWNLWNQLRSAREFNYLNDKELFESITNKASDVWKIKSRGSISSNQTADIVICKMKYKNEWDSFYGTTPEDILLIIKSGKIVFIDEYLSQGIKLIDTNDFDLIAINSAHKLIIKGVVDIMNSVHHYIPQYQFPIDPV
ncbi:MAG: amidohydrolase family protein [Ignavibacteriaceae bacterium]